MPDTPELNDAIVPVGESESPPGTGITIRVKSKVPNDKGYMVQVDYNSPLEYNVYIRPGNLEDLSPDIWVDNQQDGGGYIPYHPATGISTGPVDELAIGGEENRLYARVYNSGPGTACDIEVQFHLLTSTKGLNEKDDFALFKSVFIDKIPPGEYRDRFVTWEPLAKHDPHDYVRVNLRRLVSDSNPADNMAQESLNVAKK
jgi:hypothetical protein